LTEIARIHDKWTNKKLAIMSMDDFRKECPKDLIIINAINYRIVEMKRMPETNGSHNDTFFTYVYVEESV